MHVDVHQLGGHVDVQDVERILPLHGITRIGIGQRGGERGVDDEAAVQEHALITAVGLEKILVTDIAADADAVLRPVDAIGVPEDICAVHRHERLLFPPAEGLRNQAAVRKVAEAHFGTGEDEAIDEGGDVRLLRLVRFQEFEAYGRIIEEILHFRQRAFRARRAGGFADLSAVTCDLITLRARAFGGIAHVRDRRDGGDRLAAEPEGADVFEVLRLGYLARGVGQKYALQIGIFDAAAVVEDGDVTLAPLFDAYFYFARARVEGVLHQLLDNGIGTVDDLARRDAVVYVGA